MEIVHEYDITAHDIWTGLAEELQAHLNDNTWRVRFEGVKPIDLVNGMLTLSVPSTIARDRIESSYGQLIREIVHDLYGEDFDIELVVEVTPRGEGEREAELDATSVIALGRETDAGGSPGSADGALGDRGNEREIDSLNRNYRFEDFVIGQSNRFAHAAALSVAETPARSYNPLFIYGDAGLGKTHLLHAIGNYVRQVFPEKVVRYVSTETFMNEFVEAIRTNTGPAFKRRYRSVDVLLVDDIQFMENKEGLQEEFFHTFNSLHEARSQIVLSSDRPPKSIATLEDRLRTRFEWGLITDVQPPEFETRLAILQKKAESSGFQGVPESVFHFIASQVSDNVRELEGALIRVHAWARVNKELLTEELARRVLADLLPSKEPRMITPSLILNETAKRCDVTVDQLRGGSRQRSLVIARQMAMYVCRELTDLSFPQIGREFGNRDHTTVMYACEKISGLMSERKQIFEQVNELINHIKHGVAS